ncbi:LOW QUALITY PROTEIN: Gag protein [Phytophthora palmivora]|uniref:Gag protein n=1 Tax=Phytophthora palmivora TaxID=4796 RepID=A0A2P4X7Y2_9STRA|nr:LOW QUALITY PROTEIN: Gag protein [Phytophthora palmivora]
MSTSRSAASLVGNPLPEQIKVTVFMGGLKALPTHSCPHANTVEEAIQIALQKEFSPRQTCTPTSVWQDHNESTDNVLGPIRCCWCG